jgi:beta-1,4-mannosyl-glycoprotein beta-1,4-N-acetylglucosaminyltransferase
MQELWETVDIFIIVEADKTFAGERKQFYAEDMAFQYNLNLGHQEIRYIKVIDMPELAEPIYRPDIHVGNKWNGQFHQRNAILRGLFDLQEDDIVMISDVDEIWDPSVFSKDKKLPIVFEQIQSIGYLNILQMNFAWYGTMAVTGKMLNEFTPQDLRMVREGFPKLKGGWHFSWNGGVDKMNKKIECASASMEDIINIGYGPNKISDNISKMNGVAKIDIDLLPKYVKENANVLKRKGLLWD